MRLNGALPRRPADEGAKIRSLRMRHEERNLGGFTRIYPAPLGSADADLYQEVEVAAQRAHEEGAAKPPSEVKPPQAPTDALRQGQVAGVSDWRARANLFRPSSSSTSPVSSPLLTPIASPGQLPYKSGARRRGNNFVSLGAASDAAPSCLALKVTCNTLQRTATHCNALQRTAMHCHALLSPFLLFSLFSRNTLPHTATHCNTLQRTATHCNALQRTATHCNALYQTVSHCITLRRIAIRCITLHDTDLGNCAVFSRIRCAFDVNWTEMLLLCFVLSLALCLPLSLSLLLSLSLSLTLSRTIFLSLSHTHTHTLSLPCSPSCSVCKHSRTHTHTHTHTHTYTYTHAHAHAHTHTHTHTHTHRKQRRHLHTRKS